MFRMDRADTLAFLSQEKTTRRLIGADHRWDFSPALLNWVQTNLAAFPAGVFPRLNACSFVQPERGPLRLENAEQILKTLYHPGERAASLAFRIHRSRYDLYLCLRAWQDIPPWSEYRMFIKERRVIGVSQYHHRLVFPQITERRHQIQVHLETATATLLGLIHLATVVADIQITDTGWNLIELNPFSPDTGPALFTWNNGGDFDETLRFRTHAGTACHHLNHP